jgi:Zn-dependent protease
MSSLPLGHLFGLRVTARRSAVITFVVLLAIFFGLAVAWLGQDMFSALVFSALAALIHLTSTLLHQFGHAIAARRTGYPMIGIQLFLGLSQSKYPPDEPPLPGRVHITRALGGPLLSTLVMAVYGILTLLLLTEPLTAWWWLLVWGWLDNLLIFSLGALLPVPIFDGGTLLKWWGK